MYCYSNHVWEKWLNKDATKHECTSGSAVDLTNIAVDGFPVPFGWKLNFEGKKKCPPPKKKMFK